MRNNLYQQRKTLARKLDNPEFEQLTFKSIRHFYGTKLYHKTKDLLYVQRDMGHKQWNSTIQYIDYEKAIFGNYGDAEYIVKGIDSFEEAKKLMEVGFEYVGEIDDKYTLRKPKND